LGFYFKIFKNIQIDLKFSTDFFSNNILSMTPSVLIVMLAVIAAACLSEAVYAVFPNGLLCRSIQAPKDFPTRLYIYTIMLFSFALSHYILALH
jgi:hypothetical protein